MSDSNKNVHSVNTLSGGKTSKNTLVASSPGSISPKTFKHMIPSKHIIRLRKGSASHTISFLLKVVALEAVRRISKARCPFIWRAIQALQVFGYPPFKWIQRWEPLKFIVEGVQVVNLLALLFLLSIRVAVFNDFTSRDPVPVFSNNQWHWQVKLAHFNFKSFI